MKYLTYLLVFISCFLYSCNTKDDIVEVNDLDNLTSKYFTLNEESLNGWDFGVSDGACCITTKNEINDGKEYFRYKQVEHTKNPNVGQFDVLLEQNLITVDLLLCRPSGNGDTYSFKIKKKGMPLLFPNSNIYTL